MAKNSTNKEFSKRYAILEQEEENFIYYDDLLEDEFWRWRELGKKAKSFLKGTLGNEPQTEDAQARLASLGDELIRKGAIEREKELSVLSKLCYSKEIPVLQKNKAVDTELINIINEAFNIKTLYDAALDRLEHIFTREELKNDKGIGRLSKEFYDKYMGSAVNDTAREIMANYRAAFVNYASQQNIEGIQKTWEDFIREVKAALQDPDNPRMKKALDYIFPLPDPSAIENAQESIEELNKRRDIFRSRYSVQWGSTIKNNLDKDSAKKLMTELNGMKPTAKNRKNVNATVISKAMGGKKGSVNFLTSISESVAATLVEAINNGSGTGNMLQLVAQGLGLSKSSADIVSALVPIDNSFSVDFKITSPSGDDANKLKENARKQTESARQSFIAATADLPPENRVLIYESTKLYLERTISQGEFHGTTYSYDGAISLLEDLDINNAQVFLHKMLNEIPGTVIDTNDKQEDVQSLTDVVIKNIASFLFDDVKTIGVDAATSGTNSIHLFRLSDVVVPVSVLLIGMGTALHNSLAEANQWARVTLKTATGLTKDPGNLENWIEQREEAIGQFSISISFLYNFQRAIISALKAAR